MVRAFYSVLHLVSIFEFRRDEANCAFRIRESMYGAALKSANHTLASRDAVEKLKLSPSSPYPAPGSADLGLA